MSNRIRLEPQLEHLPASHKASLSYTASRESQDLEERGDVTRDVAFNRHTMNDGHHVSPYDHGQLQVGQDGIKVKLVQGVEEEAFKRVLSKATRATIGIQVDDDHDNRDWEEMLRGGLQTALETQVVVFEVEGVSRACTHQLVRTRKASYHQQSMRASWYGVRPNTRIPESVWRHPRSRDAFLRAMKAAHEAYNLACEEDIAYQDARYILPEGTTNYIMLEYPLREFLNVYAYRACTMFQWEIVTVMRLCRQALLAQAPYLEPYIKISCEKPQRCTFQGWESPEGQCDFPWAKDELRTFKPEFHAIKSAR